MAIDVARTTEAASKLTPLQVGAIIVIVCLAMVCGAGYVVYDGLTRVHVDLIEVKHAVERSNDAADARAAKFTATQDRMAAQIDRMAGLLAAMCINGSNGSDEARLRCEAVMVGP